METKKLKIVIPEGFEIDKENSSFEEIVFKKKETNKPESWKEYCEQQALNNKKGYQICDANCNISEFCWRGYSTIDNWRNVLPSRELTESFLAMMQLMSLRQAWIGDWKPNWKGLLDKWCIIKFADEFNIGALTTANRPLSFPTKEMASDFMNCFKDLLEIAKPLI